MGVIRETNTQSTGTYMFLHVSVSMCCRSHSFGVASFPKLAAPPSSVVIASSFLKRVKAGLYL
jgi:hypothetical protein